MRPTTDRRAVTSVEHAILAAALGVAILSVFHGISGRLALLFHQLAPAIGGHLPSI